MMMYISLFHHLTHEGTDAQSPSYTVTMKLQNLDSQLDIPAPASPLHYLTFNADCVKT